MVEQQTDNLQADGSIPSTSDSLPARTEAGQFPKGASGNPAGRPKGRRDEVKELQQKLQIAVMGAVNSEQLVRIVQRMATLAELGDTKAAKLLFDKIIPNAAPDVEDAGEQGKTFVFRVQNMTLAPHTGVAEVIDVTPIEVSK